MGLLLVARYGSKTFVGCTECVRSKVAANLGLTAIAGWWCFPWGLATPIVLLQNLAVLLAGGPGVLDDVLREAGINRADVELDDRGLTAEQRRLLRVACSVLGRAAEADGSTGPLELATAIEVIVALTDERVTADEAREALTASDRDDVSLGQAIEPDLHLLLFRIAVEVIESDRQVSSSELIFLRQLGRELGLASSVVEALLGTAPDGQGQESRVEAAYAVLGLAPGSPARVVRQRYRQLMMTHHPDRASQSGVDADEAIAASQQINEAYKTIMSSPVAEN